MAFKIFLFILVFSNTVKSLPNGGHHHDHDHGHEGHDHDHSHGHDHHHHGEDCQKEEVVELADIIKSLGIKILGKDQESANDVAPSEDHNHLNVKALINELFFPSTAPPPVTTTTPPHTSTASLPIKSHKNGWDKSPIDLIMNNQILEPVFEEKKHGHGHTTQSPQFLTETQYYLEKDELEHFGVLDREAKHFVDEVDQDIDQLTDKPVIPVVDTRWANFVLVHRRRRNFKATDASKHSTSGRDSKKLAVEARVIPSSEQQKQTVNLLPETTTISPLSIKQKENEILLESLQFLLPPDNTEVESNFLNDQENLLLINDVQDSTPNPESFGLDALITDIFTEDPSLLPNLQHLSNTQQQIQLNSIRQHRIQQEKQRLREKQQEEQLLRKQQQDELLRKEKEERLQRQKQIQESRLQKQIEEQEKLLRRQEELVRQQEEKLRAREQKRLRDRELQRIREREKERRQKAKHRQIEEQKRLAKSHDDDKGGRDDHHHQVVAPPVLNGQFVDVNLVKSTTGSRKEPRVLNSRGLSHRESRTESPHKESSHRNSRFESSHRNSSPKDTRIETSQRGSHSSHRSSRFESSQRNSRTGFSQRDSRRHSTRIESRMDHDFDLDEESLDDPFRGLDNTLPDESDDKSSRKEKKLSSKSNSGSTNKLLTLGLASQEVIEARRPQPSPRALQEARNQGKSLKSFDCRGMHPGLYADTTSNCKRFIMCHENGRMGTFKCPAGTLFNQDHQICDWRKRVECGK